MCEYLSVSLLQEVEVVNPHFSRVLCHTQIRMFLRFSPARVRELELEEVGHEVVKFSQHNPFRCNQSLRSALVKDEPKCVS